MNSLLQKYDTETALSLKSFLYTLKQAGYICELEQYHLDPKNDSWREVSNSKGHLIQVPTHTFYTVTLILLVIRTNQHTENILELLNEKYPLLNITDLNYDSFHLNEQKQVMLLATLRCRPDYDWNGRLHDIIPPYTFCPKCDEVMEYLYGDNDNLLFCRACNP